MNKVILEGRITKDLELKYSTGNSSKAILRFNLAVNRRYKNSEGRYEADFPSCVAFDKTAEFISKYFHKGDPILITGHIQTGEYTDRDGNKKYTTDVIVEDGEFTVGSKNSGGNSGGNSGAPKAAASNDNSFVNVPDNSDDELPFN